MAETVNNILDKLISVGWRLLDLPVYALLMLVIGILLPAILFWFRAAKRKHFSPSRSMLLTIVGILLPMALIIDFKMKTQQTEIELLSQKYINALNANQPTTPSQMGLLLKDEDRKDLTALLPNLKVWQRPIHDAITLLTFKKENPKATFFCAVIDLTYPGLEPMITSKYTEWKTLTSEFAKQNDCIIAINGEAGDGVFQESGYGEWVGNWVVNGKPITMLDNEERPFLSFDRYNKASYSPEKEVVTEVSDAMYNTIWGRWDLLVDGKAPTFESKRIYARCIMGIDETGDKLYLMVVDGKRHEYSKGLSLDECSKLLLKLGVHNAMACDQGGSVCMYVEPMKGIINRPADNNGEERVVYTHFGIRVI